MQIGCCIPTACYTAAADAGYDYAEFSGFEIHSLTEEAFQSVLETVRQRKLPVACMNDYLRTEPAIIGPQFDPDAIRAYAELTLSRAGQLGVRCVGVGAPAARHLPDGYDRALADSQCAEFFRITAEVAAKYGITMMVEALNAYFGNYITVVPEAVAMARQVNRENVGVIVDLYHMQRMDEDWNGLAQYLPLTRHMHVSPPRDGGKRGIYAPGDEELCRRAFAAIAASGYDGTVSVESNDGKLAFSDLKTALDLMRASLTH